MSNLLKINVVQKRWGNDDNCVIYLMFTGVERRQWEDQDKVEDGHQQKCIALVM
jgi:hypothetical protein